MESIKVVYMNGEDEIAEIECEDLIYAIVVAQELGGKVRITN